MTKSLPTKLKISLSILIAAAALESLSIALYQSLDKIVNVTLYNYGLQFSNDWAKPYWNNYALFQNFLLIATALTIASAISLILYARKHTQKYNALFYPLSIAASFCALSSIYFITKIDYIVNNTLYNYNLTFSNEWATAYWTDISILMATAATAATITFVAVIPTWLNSHKLPNITYPKLVYTILIPAGITVLIISMIFLSGETAQVFAFVGLGLLFWGITFTFIRTDEYVKKSLLETTTTSQTETTNQILRELKLKSQSIYLPPKYFNNPDKQKVYISKHNPIILPTITEIRNQESKFLINNSNYILITPIGEQLEKLIEKTLGKNFHTVNLEYLEQNLPKVIAEDLEIAKNVRAEIEKDLFKVKIIEPTSETLITNPKWHEDAQHFLDSPLSSAIAIALAKSTNKIVLIDKHKTRQDGKEVKLEYHILEGVEVNNQ